ncbi:MAG: multidrug effflux MFS transporter [Steroidobacteraceae bacterium]
MLLLAACTALGPCSTLLLMPALPAIRVDFGATTAATQSVVSAFLFSLAVGMIFGGPLSDRYGRRPLILGGLVVVLLGSALSAAAPTLGVLVLARVVQALGCATIGTVARAVVGDIYDDWRLARALANLTLVMMAATTISPFFGGLLTETWGWHSTFIVLIVLASATLFACWRALPETRGVQHRGASFAQLGRSSIAVLRNPRFSAYLVDAGVIYAVYLVFISIAPYVLAEMLHRPATDFGQYTLMISAGYFAGNLYVARRGRAGNMASIARVGVLLQAASAIVALGCVLLGWTHPAFWFVPMMPLAFAQGLALPHVMASAVQLSPGYAGVASSLIGFGQQAVAAISVQAMGLARTDTPLPMLWCCAALSLVSVATLYLLGSHAPARPAAQE